MTAHRAPRTAPSLQPDLFRLAPIQFVRQVLTEFLQGLFQQQPVGSYHWAPGEDSEIYISSEAPVKASIIGTRPAIALTRAPMRMRTLGLDDMVGMDMQSGAKMKSVTVPGTMIINACSRVPLESENIAFHAGEQLWILRDILQKMGFYQIGQDIGYGSPSPAGSIVAGDGGDEWYATSVTIPFIIQRTAKLTPLGLQMARAIELRIFGSFMPEAQPEVRHSIEPGLSSTGEERPADPAPLRVPGAEPYPDIQRNNGIRPPRIKGRQLPITGSTVPESPQRGLNGPLTVKV